MSISVSIVEILSSPVEQAGNEDGKEEHGDNDECRHQKGQDVLPGAREQRQVALVSWIYKVHKILQCRKQSYTVNKL